MTLTPICRKEMQRLHVNENPSIEYSQTYIKKLIHEIYTNAVETAKNTPNTSYESLPIALGEKQLGSKTVNEILDELTRLFPECTVRHVIKLQNIKGSLHNEECIVINWDLE